MPPGYVYAIHSPESPSHVKLGLSADPESRLKRLQTGNPYRLQLIWTHPCPDMTAVESVLHGTFEKYRIPGGEWFDLRPIDDPEHLAQFLDLLATKYLTEDLPAEMQARLANLEPLIGSPGKFLNSQVNAEAIFAAQFADLAKYENDPAALEAYILRSLRRR